MVNQAMSLTYEQTTKMFAAFPSEVRQAGGCMAYIEKGGSIRADGTTTDGTVLPLGLDPILSACNAGIAGR